MTHHPVTVTPGTTVKEALALLARHSVAALPVVSVSGRIQGVVSEADLIRDMVEPDARIHEIPLETTTLDHAAYVAEVMSTHAVTVTADTDLAEAIELITSTAVKSVPVVDRHDRVTGMLSRSDVVRLLARPDDTLEAEVDAVLRSLALGDWLVEVHDGIVEVTGPEDARHRSIARAAAATVPGIVEVRIS
ncbi:MAG: HPP family protein [Nocardioides sp.]